MKVAIVHDWLTGMRGGERCLFAFLALYPQADIYTLLHVPGTTSPEIDRRVKGTSMLQRMPFAGKLYRYYLPLYPAAIRSLSFEGYDLVLSLSHAAAKNIQVPPGVRHICYCFTPMRYIWDQAESYFGKMTPLLQPLLSRLRRWDRDTGNPDRLIAISQFVRERIVRCYGRDAEVIYPPVETSWIKPIPRLIEGEAFLCAGALVPYKKIHVAVEAFNRLGFPLWIAGSGPEEERLRAMAGPNILFFGRVSDEELASLYAHSRALVFPGVEDFGMIPVECMAAGRPVIACEDGGVTETVDGISVTNATGAPEGKTGVFYPRNHAGSEVEGLMKAVRYFVNHEQAFMPETCIAQAAKFTPDRFFASWQDLSVAPQVLSVGPRPIDRIREQVG